MFKKFLRKRRGKKEDLPKSVLLEEVDEETGDFSNIVPTGLSTFQEIEMKEWNAPGMVASHEALESDSEAEEETKEAPPASVVPASGPAEGDLLGLGSIWSDPSLGTFSGVDPSTSKPPESKPTVRETSGIDDLIEEPLEEVESSTSKSSLKSICLGYESGFPRFLGFLGPDGMALGMGVEYQDGPTMTIQYRGHFKHGYYEGEGTQYHPKTGLKWKEGTFARGKMIHGQTYQVNEAGTEITVQTFFDGQLFETAQVGPKEGDEGVGEAEMFDLLASLAPTE